MATVPVLTIDADGQSALDEVELSALDDVLEDVAEDYDYDEVPELGGFFSSLKKIAKKVGRASLAVSTGGASEAYFNRKKIGKFAKKHAGKLGRAGLAVSTFGQSEVIRAALKGGKKRRRGKYKGKVKLPYKMSKAEARKYVLGRLRKRIGKVTSLRGQLMKGKKRKVRERKAKLPKGFRFSTAGKKGLKGFNFGALAKAAKKAKKRKKLKRRKVKAKKKLSPAAARKLTKVLKKKLKKAKPIKVSAKSRVQKAAAKHTAQRIAAMSPDVSKLSPKARLALAAAFAGRPKRSCACDRPVARRMARHLAEGRRPAIVARLKPGAGGDALARRLAAQPLSPIQFRATVRGMIGRMEADSGVSLKRLRLVTGVGNAR